MNLAVVLATVVPLLALTGLLILGRNWTRLWPLALLALAWGILDTFIVVHINDRWALAFGITSLIVIGAPIAEEITKALALPFMGISRRVTWFVDGAVLGAAAGTGFAIRENWLYLERVGNDAALSLALARITSTNLMHAGCTAIVGAAIILTFSRGGLTRLGIPFLGLVIAISLHSSFNWLTENEGGSALLITATGVAVFGIAGGIIYLGFPLSARWVREDLARQGATASEQSALTGSSVSAILDAFEARYGSDAADKAEELVEVQRKIAILQHGSRGNESEVAQLQQDAANLRRQIGMFAMMWLRSHLPLESKELGMWDSLSEAVPQQQESSQEAPSGLWARLSEVPFDGDSVTGTSNSNLDLDSEASSD